MKCRICSNMLVSSTSFGKMPIANGFLSQEHFKKEYFFDLGIAFCERCKMLQLLEQPEPEMMFHENYAFFSSTSKKMGEHFEKMANEYQREFLTGKDGFIIELGSNDGIMLKHFAKSGISHLGIEPSYNVAEVARKNGINTMSSFFNEDTAGQVVKQYGQADVISAANVMCHIPDLHSVAKGVNCLLKPTGVFVFEDPYLGDMIQKTSYDQIYDEHVYIFSVQSVANTFGFYGLEVFHVEPQSTHGGSMRYYLSRKNARTIRPSVGAQLEIEKNLGLDKAETYHQFGEACERNKKSFTELLTALKSQGKRVVGYAATSKSTTILNYCNVGPDLIDYICDTTPIKQGKYSPGMHIPIKSYEVYKSDNPDYVILFAWNHEQEIFEKEKDLEKRGGKWISFVPEVRVL